MEAIQPYATAVGTSHIFIATDSEVVLADAARLYPQYKLLFMPNVTRSGLTNPVPTEILDELIKRRMRSGRGVQDTERHAIMGVLDALLLSRCDVLVGKFSSGLFRASYALAAARRGGALPPFVSLDAPWCADYGVPADLTPSQSAAASAMCSTASSRLIRTPAATERCGRAGRMVPVLSRC